MRKYFFILALALLGAARLSAQPIISPWQYRNRLFLNLQTGTSFFVSENSGALAGNNGYNRFSFYNEAILGYYFTDAHEMRVSLAYAKRAAVMPPLYGFLPYTFGSTQAFVDYVINWRALGEYNTAYIPQMYVGVGGAVTGGFSELDYEPIEDLPHLHTFNIVPALRFGVILEYDFRNNFGLTFDIGAQFYHDRFNGQDPDNWPIDLQYNATFGVVYHFGGDKKGRD